MTKQKSTGDLLKFLKKKSSYAEGQEKIRDEQYSESLSAYLNGIAVVKDMMLADIMRRSGLKKHISISYLTDSGLILPVTCLFSLDSGFRCPLTRFRSS